MLVKVVRRVSYPFMGYLFLLLAFALLGLFVVALAYRSGWAAVAGVALGGALVVAVVGFRQGAVKLAQSCGEGDPLHCVNILSEPLRQEEVDQYCVNYRGGQRLAQCAVALRASRPNQSEAPEAIVPSRLPARSRARAASSQNNQIRSVAKPTPVSAAL
jgi:hypothetical protein